VRSFSSTSARCGTGSAITQPLCAGPTGSERLNDGKTPATAKRAIPTWSSIIAFPARRQGWHGEPSRSPRYGEVDRAWQLCANYVCADFPRTARPVPSVRHEAAAPPARCSFDAPYTSVVDAVTGAAIKKWLDKGFRKPNDVLVLLRADTWMNSAQLEAYARWSDYLVPTVRSRRRHHRPRQWCRSAIACAMPHAGTSQSTRHRSDVCPQDRIRDWTSSRPCRESEADQELPGTVRTRRGDLPASIARIQKQQSGARRVQRGQD